MSSCRGRLFFVPSGTSPIDSVTVSLACQLHIGADQTSMYRLLTHMVLFLCLAGLAYLLGPSEYIEEHTFSPMFLEVSLLLGRRVERGPRGSQRVNFDCSVALVCDFSSLCLHGPGVWPASHISVFVVALLVLRGTIVNRTYGLHKNLYIYLFLLKIFGPLYYGPP